MGANHEHLSKQRVHADGLSQCVIRLTTLRVVAQDEVLSLRRHTKQPSSCGITVTVHSLSLKRGERGVNLVPESGAAHGDLSALAT